MASFEVSYAWMQSNEDAADLHAIVPDKCPEGCTLDHCFAISGINSAVWPDEYKRIANLPSDRRGPYVQAFYEAKFWCSNVQGNSWYSQLTSDDLCKRVFDMDVNAGSVAAVRCLQEAANLLAALTACAQVAEDGRWGPATVATANDSTVTSLVAIFQDRRVAYYDALIAKHPSLAIYKAGWTARALK